MHLRSYFTVLSCLAFLMSCQKSSDTDPTVSMTGQPAKRAYVAVNESSGEPVQCSVIKDESFIVGHETVRLGRSKGLPASANFAMFVSPLAVNTDGAPTSYHPHDFLGKSLAINRIDNGIAIRKNSSLTLTEKISAFEKWRDSGWTAPAGYSVSWQNVIAQDDAGRPCVFASGPNKGYFGSLTALKNGLLGAVAGECQVANQLDQRFIPAIVLRGDTNPLKGFGARTGDLVVALNPASGKSVAAVIGDTGDGDRIGEGSVALNMALLGKTLQPKTYADALKLDTGHTDMVVAVLPGTATYNRVRPYTTANIAERVNSWAKEQGYGSTAGLARVAQACGTGL
ncbi:hypothetical protein HFN88_05205 [Rhizobium laguerreae]|uniref:hypothetical protein n=1 Tax=Rhizobium laguerreae TaxID=1076926 RepID=UPI001C918BC4|nr:hypothetical protein [Rhizobium laguerreae]MBY3329005.1 hypothetical protein [Rhizobium laguerreae]MBY3392083.1 hypothetical protein [Rhizobium laguerreae]